MTKKQRAAKVCELLEIHYPYENKCHLSYEKDYELLFATIMSAQCTDERVNMVTKKLFQKFNTLTAFANADQNELEKEIFSTGFYKQKAKHIIETANILLDTYEGKLPSEIEKLVTLPGVGRKTANVVRGNIFHIPSVVVDTHVSRISFRIGLTNSKNPIQAEKELEKVLPIHYWIAYNHQIIHHGRNVCTARKAKCKECFLSEVCLKIM